MSQTEQIIEAFKSRGWRATLGELLEEGRYSFSHEMRARFTDLRKKGYEIKCEKGPNPSQNLYTMIPPHGPSFKTDETGQMVFI